MCFCVFYDVFSNAMAYVLFDLKNCIQPLMENNDIILLTLSSHRYGDYSLHFQDAL